MKQITIKPGCSEQKRKQLIGLNRLLAMKHLQKYLDAVKSQEIK